MPRLYWKESKGYGSRCGYQVDMIIFHYTWGHFEGDLATLCSKQASSHFYIPRNGNLWWLVRLENRAFHAGINGLLAPKRFARIRPNERSIGIEIEGFGTYEEDQYRALEFLLPLLLKRFHIPHHFLPDPYLGCDPKAKSDRYEIEMLENFRGILAHGNIHGTKTDPGLNFDWERFKYLPTIPDPGCLDYPEDVIYRGDPNVIPKEGIRYDFKLA